MQYKQKRQTMLRNPWNATFVHHCCCPKHTMWHQHSKKENHKCKTCWQKYCRYPRSMTLQCVPHSKNCSEVHFFYLITLKMQIMTMCTSRGELLFFFVHLRFTAQVKDHPHWIAAIMMICASMEELQFYFVHWCFTAQAEDHPHWMAAIMITCTSMEELLFYIVHLCFTAQGEHHPHWIAAIMMMSASMEELQFYVVHLYFTAEGEDHTPLNCCNHDNVCFNTQELQFYFVHFCSNEQVIPHWIAAKRERIAAKKN